MELKEKFKDTGLYPKFDVNIYGKGLCSIVENGKEIIDIDEVKIGKYDFISLSINTGECLDTDIGFWQNMKNFSYKIGFGDTFILTLETEDNNTKCKIDFDLEEQKIMEISCHSK